MKKNIIKSFNDIHNIAKLIKIKILVISGGGMKGLEFLGVIKYLDKLNLLKYIDEYYGCSIGSYICLLLIIGYSIDDIINFSINFDFKTLIGKIDDLIYNYSFGKYELFINILKSKIILKNINADITFKELYEMTKKNFNVIGYNISQKKEIIINHITYPNMKIWEGIYLSCALPMLFKPYLYENEYYCDGGTSNICPINLIPPEKQKYTIGISSKIFVDNVNIDILIENKNLNNLFKFIFELFYISFDREKYKHDIYKNIIWLENCDKFSMLRFNSNKEDKINLIKHGYFFTKNNILKILNYIIIINKN